jgi:uncharacterized membrane protein YczE
LAVFFLLHSPSGFPAWALPSTLPFGVRTFLATAKIARLPGLQAQHIAAPRRHDASVSRPHPSLRGNFRTRFAVLTGGLILYGFGDLLTVRADIGLGPWDVLHQALARHTGVSFGVVIVVVSFAVLLLAAALGERPGLGTVMNALVVGGSFYVFDRLDLAPHAHGGVGGVAWDVLGIVLIGIASALYIGASMGAGPRDSLMLAVAHRGARIAVASVTIQVSALAVGWALGGSAGIGTLLFAFGLGPCMEVAFSLLVRLGLTQPPRTHVPAAAASPAIGST